MREGDDVSGPYTLCCYLTYYVCQIDGIQKHLCGEIRGNAVLFGSYSEASRVVMRGVSLK